MTDTRSADTILAELDGLMQRAEYIQAFDVARTGVAAHPDHVQLRHRGVLALARMGASARARDLYEDWGLQDVHGDEDVLALWARLKKDHGRQLTGQARRQAFAEAARAYALSFEYGGGGYYPAVNVASLCLLADLPEDAREWASKARHLATHGDYWSLATQAEAAVVLGEAEAARSLLDEAALLATGDYAALATTRQQLQEIIAHRGGDPGLLAALVAPRVAHFCGHMATGPGGRMPNAEIPRVTQAISDQVRTQDIGFAVGSLAGGTDILVAEAVLDAGGEVSIVLPFGREEFVDVSVRPSGEDWVARFNACLEAAHSVHYVTADAYLGNASLFAYTTHFGLGLARLRAQMLGTELVQLAVWDGQAPAPDAAAGTVYDVAMARRMGLTQHLIPARATDHLDPGAFTDIRPPDGEGRQERTMIFGDLKGFSKLTDAQIPGYVDTVLGTCADVLAAHGAHLKFRNTWGDGIFLVFDDLAAAADCAFALQHAVSGIDRAAHDLPETLGLRLGLHHGPVFETRDPVLGRANYFGYHVSRAARVEPITPEGEVYVTEQAAAALAVDAYGAFRCDYVGRVPLAKGYGAFPMYALTRRQECV